MNSYFDEKMVIEQMREAQRTADWAQNLGLTQGERPLRWRRLGARLGHLLVSLGRVYSERARSLDRIFPPSAESTDGECLKPSRRRGASGPSRRRRSVGVTSRGSSTNLTSNWEGSVTMQVRGCGCGGASGPQTVSDEACAAAPIRPLATTLSWRDVLGGWRVRWGIGRMRYRVEPGLYRIGEPTPASPVLVTANYKLTVDTVRRAVKDLDVWLLILDTKGVNVWCAAGKGTFGTAELVHRLHRTGLGQVVTHRRLILPQLGAVGVAAHEVQRLTGFTVRYGPVLARDIPGYLQAGLRATPAMRRVPFGWKERLILTPMELMGSWKLTLGTLAALLLVHLLQHRALTPQLAGELVPVAGAVLGGGVLVPVLLPWIPGRAFALKGAIVGAAWATLACIVFPAGLLEGLGVALIATAVTSFLAMSFTGASTITSYAGTRLEVRWALPALVAAAGVGGLLRLAALVA